MLTGYIDAKQVTESAHQKTKQETDKSWRQEAQITEERSMNRNICFFEHLHMLSFLHVPT